MDFFASDEPWGVPLTTVLLMMPFLLDTVPSQGMIVVLILNLMYPGTGGYGRDGSETTLIRVAGATDMVDFLSTMSQHSLTMLIGTDYEICANLAEASAKWWTLPYEASDGFLGGANHCSEWMDYATLAASSHLKNPTAAGRPRSTGSPLHDVACMLRWLRRSAPGTGVEVGDFQYSQSTVWIVIRHTIWAMSHALNDLGMYNWPTQQQALDDWNSLLVLV